MTLLVEEAPGRYGLEKGIVVRLRKHLLHVDVIERTGPELATLDRSDHPILDLIVDSAEGIGPDFVHGRLSNFRASIAAARIGPTRAATMAAGSGADLPRRGQSGPIRRFSSSSAQKKRRSRGYRRLPGRIQSIKVMNTLPTGVGFTGTKLTGFPVAIASEIIATLSAVTQIESAIVSNSGYDGGP
jgi:hypothetical protein